MISSLVRALISTFKARRELALENVALRQQLAVVPSIYSSARLEREPFYVLEDVLIGRRVQKRGLFGPMPPTGASAIKCWSLPRNPLVC